MSRKLSSALKKAFVSGLLLSSSESMQRPQKTTITETEDSALVNLVKYAPDLAHNTFYSLSFCDLWSLESTSKTLNGFLKSAPQYLMLVNNNIDKEFIIPGYSPKDLLKYWMEEDDLLKKLIKGLIKENILKNKHRYTSPIPADVRPNTFFPMPPFIDQGEGYSPSTQPNNIPKSEANKGANSGAISSDIPVKNTKKKKTANLSPEEDLLYRIKKIVSQSTTKSLRIPHVILGDYLDLLLNSINSRKKDLIEEAKPLFLKPTQDLTGPEKIIKAAMSIELAINNLNIIDKDEKNKLMKDLISLIESRNTQDFTIPDLDALYSEMSTLKAGINSVEKIQAIEELQKAKDQVDDFLSQILTLSIEDVYNPESQSRKMHELSSDNISLFLQNLTNKINTILPANLQGKRNSPYEIFTSDTFSKVAQFCEFVNTLSFIFLDMKMDSGYNITPQKIVSIHLILRENLNLALEYTNYIDSRAQEAKIYTQYFLAELNRLEKKYAESQQLHKSVYENKNSPLALKYQSLFWLADIERLNRGKVAAIVSCLDPYAFKNLGNNGDISAVYRAKARLRWASMDPNYLEKFNHWLKKSYFTSEFDEDDLNIYEELLSSINGRKFDSKPQNTWIPPENVQSLTNAEKSSTEIAKISINNIIQIYDRKIDKNFYTFDYSNRHDQMSQFDFDTPFSRPSYCESYSDNLTPLNFSAPSSYTDFQYGDINRATINRISSSQFITFAKYLSTEVDYLEASIVFYHTDDAREFTFEEKFAELIKNENEDIKYLEDSKSDMVSESIDILTMVPADFNSSMMQLSTMTYRPKTLEILPFIERTNRKFESPFLFNPNFEKIFLRLVNKYPSIMEENKTLLNFIQNISNCKESIFRKIREDYLNLLSSHATDLPMKARIRFRLAKMDFLGQGFYINNQQTKEDRFKSIRHTYHEISGASDFMLTREKAVRDIQGMSDRLKNNFKQTIAMSVLEGVINEIAKKDVNAKNQILKILTDAKENLKKSTPSNYENFMTQVCNSMKSTWGRYTLAPEIDAQKIYINQCENEGSDKLNILMKILLKHQNTLKSLAYDSLAQNNAIIDQMTLLKEEFEKAGSLFRAEIENAYSQKKPDIIDRLKAKFNLVQMDRFEQGIDWPSVNDNIASTDYPDYGRMRQDYLAIKNHPDASKKLKLKAEFSILEMNRQGQLSDAGIPNLLEAYKKLLRDGDCKDTIRIQIKLAIAEIHYRMGNFAKAFDTFSYIINTPMAAKELKNQAEQGLARIIHYKQIRDINLPETVYNKYDFRISQSIQDIKDIVKKAEDLLPTIFPMKSADMVKIKSNSDDGMVIKFPIYSQIENLEAKEKTVLIYKELEKIDKDPVIFDFLKTDVKLWLAIFKYHGYADFHHSFIISRNLFHKITHNPDFTTKQRAVANLYLAQIHLFSPLKRDFSVAHQALTFVLNNTEISDNESILAQYYLNYMYKNNIIEPNRGSNKRSGDTIDQDRTVKYHKPEDVGVVVEEVMEED